MYEEIPATRLGSNSLVHFVSGAMRVLCYVFSTVRYVRAIIGLQSHLIPLCTLLGRQYSETSPCMATPVGTIFFYASQLSSPEARGRQELLS